MKRTVLRGAYALQGPRFQFERRPVDVLVEGERITAIEPAGAIPGADASSICPTTGWTRSRSRR